jgi:hypothetical protein
MLLGRLPLLYGGPAPIGLPDLFFIRAAIYPPGAPGVSEGVNKVEPRALSRATALRIIRGIQDAPWGRLLKTLFSAQE